jgi:UDP-glucose 4-epimerase
VKISPGIPVLVTGGSGFLGSYLVEALLSKGCDVTILDLEGPAHTPEVTFVRGSVLDAQVVRTVVERAKVVFHLAGLIGTYETMERARLAAEVNIIGTLNVLDAAREHRAPVLYVGKPDYGRNPYTITKVAAEQFSLMYRDQFGMDVRAVRCFDVYGPRQPTESAGYKKALPSFILNAIQNRPLTIYGSGTQVTDYIHARDAAEAIVAVCDSEFSSPGPVDIGNGHEFSVNFVAREVIRLSDSASQLQYVNRYQHPGAGGKTCADLTTLQDTIKFRPKVPFEQGIRETIEFYRTLALASRQLA